MGSFRWACRPRSLSSIHFEPRARKCGANLTLLQVFWGVTPSLAASMEVSARKEVSFAKDSFTCVLLLGGPPSPKSLLGSHCQVYHVVLCRDCHPRHYHRLATSDGGTGSGEDKRTLACAKGWSWLTGLGSEGPGWLVWWPRRLAWRSRRLTWRPLRIDC